MANESTLEQLLGSVRALAPLLQKGTQAQQQTARALFNQSAQVQPFGIINNGPNTMDSYGRQLVTGLTQHFMGKGVGTLAGNLAGSLLFNKNPYTDQGIASTAAAQTPFVTSGITYTGAFFNNSQAAQAAMFDTMAGGMGKSVRQQFYRKLTQNLSGATSSTQLDDTVKALTSGKMSGVTKWMLDWTDISQAKAAASMMFSGVSAMGSAGISMGKTQSTNVLAQALATKLSDTVASSAGMGGFDPKAKATLAAILTAGNGFGLQGNAITGEGHERVAEQFSGRVKKMAGAMGALRDVFGQDMQSLINTMSTIFGSQGMQGVAAQTIQQLAGGIVSTLRLTGKTTAQLQQVVAATKQGMQSMGVTNGYQLTGAVGVGVTSLGMAGGIYRPNTMSNADFANLAANNMSSIAGSRSAQAIANAYGAWLQSNKTGTQDDFLAEIGRRVENGKSATQAAFQLAGVNAFNHSRFAGTKGAVQMKQSGSAVGIVSRSALASRLQNARRFYTNSGNDAAQVNKAFQILKGNLGGVLMNTNDIEQTYKAYTGHALDTATANLIRQVKGDNPVLTATIAANANYDRAQQARQTDAAMRAAWGVLDEKRTGKLVDLLTSSDSTVEAQFSALVNIIAKDAQVGKTQFIEKLLGTVVMPQEYKMAKPEQKDAIQRSKQQQFLQYFYTGKGSTSAYAQEAIRTLGSVKARGEGINDYQRRIEAAQQTLIDIQTMGVQQYDKYRELTAQQKKEDAVAKQWSAGALTSKNTADIQQYKQTIARQRKDYVIFSQLSDKMLQGATEAQKTEINKVLNKIKEKAKAEETDLTRDVVKQAVDAVAGLDSSTKQKFLDAYDNRGRDANLTQLTLARNALQRIFALLQSKLGGQEKKPESPATPASQEASVKRKAKNPGDALGDLILDMTGENTDGK